MAWQLIRNGDCYNLATKRGLILLTRYIPMTHQSLEALASDLALTPDLWRVLDGMKGMARDYLANGDPSTPEGQTCELLLKLLAERRST